VSASSTAYAAAHLHDLIKGETVAAVIGTIDGGEYSRSEQTIEENANDRWLAFPLSLSGLSPGEYAVYIYVNGVPLNSLVFQVTF
jgi:hypothetical protein